MKQIPRWYSPSGEQSIWRGWFMWRATPRQPWTTSSSESLHYSLDDNIALIMKLFSDNVGLLFSPACAEHHPTEFTERRSVRCEPWLWICSLRPCTVRCCCCSKEWTTTPSSSDQGEAALAGPVQIDSTGFDEQWCSSFTKCMLTLKAQSWNKKGQPFSFS